MSTLSFVIVHGSHGVEVTALEYLYRVLLYLLAFGGTAILVFLWTGVVKTIYAAFRTKRGREENER